MKDKSYLIRIHVRGSPDWNVSRKIHELSPECLMHAISRLCSNVVGRNLHRIKKIEVNKGKRNEKTYIFKKETKTIVKLTKQEDENQRKI